MPESRRYSEQTIDKNRGKEIGGFGCTIAFVVIGRNAVSTVACKAGTNAVELRDSRIELTMLFALAGFAARHSSKPL